MKEGSHPWEPFSFFFLPQKYPKATKKAYRPSNEA